MKKGQVTFPIDTTILDESVKIMREWGADAIRDCDGTELPKGLDLDVKVYSTYFVTRGDNRFAEQHLDELQHFYLVSLPVTAVGQETVVRLTDGFLDEQVQADFDADPHKYWEAVDRTAGVTVPPEKWSADRASGTVTITQTEPMHEYTVTFFARAVWDSTQMYNYITNNWTREKELPYDPRYPATRQYIRDHLAEWLRTHGDADVVRFTSFLYHFTLLFNDKRREKYVDWFGYNMACSPRAMDDFEQEYGYRLRPEDIVDAGYYNTPFRVPTKAYRDYMRFIQRFVTDIVKELTGMVHAAGKETMMFWGDTWVGVEPYGEFFPETGLDAVVGSVGSGITVRMLSDIPGIKYTEGRFLPYFFPDTFREGGEPTKEFDKVWSQARRAMLVKPLDRIGFGGYLNLAAKFPDFVSRVTDVCEEYRTIYRKIKGKKPNSVLTCGVLNSWGKLRSWQAYMVAHELWYPEIYSYMGILESLCGLPVEVKFLSFDEVRAGGVPEGVDVLINAGAAGTAFSGGEEWLDAELVCKVRQWIYDGGGFIGVGQPSAVQSGGRYFQLAAALGVEQELGFTLSHDKYNIAANRTHFILRDTPGAIDYGEGTKNVYALDTATVLDIDVRGPERDVNVGEVKMAANAFGKGRCFYMAGCPYSDENARILLRAMCWTAGREQALSKNFSVNPHTEYHSYGSGEACIVNNTSKQQRTEYLDGKGKRHEAVLAPMEILWL